MSYFVDPEKPPPQAKGLGGGGDHGMAIPIPDLDINEGGIYGTLSFRGSPFVCFIPWEAVYALVVNGNKGRVWEECLPKALVRGASNSDIKALKPETKDRKLGSKTSEAPKEKKQSKVVKPLTSLNKERPSWLRVVKGGKPN